MLQDMKRYTSYRFNAAVRKINSHHIYNTPTFFSSNNNLDFPWNIILTI